MSRLRFNKIATPATPAANKGEVFYSSTMSPAALGFVNESGSVFRVGGTWTNSSTGAVGGGFAADTYMAGTQINTGNTNMWQAGMVYVARFDMTKTAAGVAAPIITVRMGTLATTGDAAVLTLTGQAQTGAADTGYFEVIVQFRSVGSGTSAVIAGGFQVIHNLSTTGFTSGATVSTLTGASSGFNSTTSNIIGVSFNGGAAFSGTNTWNTGQLTV